MSATSPHQVSIQAIEAVSGVGVIVRLGLLVADIVHYLVLSLTRDLHDYKVTEAIHHLPQHRTMRNTIITQKTNFIKPS